MQRRKGVLQLTLDIQQRCRITDVVIPSSIISVTRSSGHKQSFR